MNDSLMKCLLAPIVVLGLEWIMSLYLVDKLMVEVWHLKFPQAAHSFIVVTRG